MAGLFPAQPVKEHLPFKKKEGGGIEGTSKRRPYLRGPSGARSPRSGTPKPAAFLQYWEGGSL